MGIRSATGTFVFKKSYETVFSAVMSALTELGFVITSANKDLGEIKSKYSMNLRSWGGKFNVYVVKSPQGVEVHANSRTGWGPVGFIDLGRSSNNVNKLFQILERRLK